MNDFNTVTPRPEKVAVVEEVTTKLSAADAVIVTEYRGMSVGQLAGLRRTLRDAGGEYKVYKNTLARFAAQNAGVSDLDFVATLAQRRLKLLRKTFVGTKAVAGHQAVAESDDAIGLRRCEPRGAEHQRRRRHAPHGFECHSSDPI